MLQCFKNAQVVESCSITDRALHYGDGCFSTARLYQGKLLLKDRHWTRLKRAATQLSLHFDFDLIESSLARLAQHAALHDQAPLNGTLKILVSRGESGRGYSLPQQAADVYVYYYPHQQALPSIEQFDSGVLDLQMGLSMPSLVGVKSLNRLEQVMLKQQADQCGWPEALVCDVQGHVVEGVSSNCFFQINGQWITPELRYNGVHGVMRAEILARMQQQQLECTQRLVMVDEIEQIQSLFFCNALAPMKVVHHLNLRTLATQPCVDLFKTLQLDIF